MARVPSPGSACVLPRRRDLLRSDWSLSRPFILKKELPLALPAGTTSLGSVSAEAAACCLFSLEACKQILDFKKTLKAPC
jgi:hypothetical protein